LTEQIVARLKVGSEVSTVYQGDVLAWLHRTPVDLCVSAFLLLAAVMLAVDPLRRLRLARRLVRRAPTCPAAPRLRFAGTQVVAGSVSPGRLGLLAPLRVPPRRLPRTTFTV